MENVRLPGYDLNLAKLSFDRWECSCKWQKKKNGGFFLGSVLEISIRVQNKRPNHLKKIGAGDKKSNISTQDDEKTNSLIVAEHEKLAESYTESVVATGLNETLEQKAKPIVKNSNVQKQPSKETFFTRLKKSLLRTKQNIGFGLLNLFRGKKIDDDFFEQLEE
ncbi:hypothetical protein Rin_00001020, partial [Candidatus Regiella insecticola 5.15]